MPKLIKIQNYTKACSFPIFYRQTLYSIFPIKKNEVSTFFKMNCKTKRQQKCKQNVYTIDY